MKSKKRTKLMPKIKIEEKRLFLNYSMPCLVERVRKGELTWEEFEDFCQDVVNDKDIPDEELYKLFPVAMSFIEDSADKVGKKRDGEITIDRDVIHQYFWQDHDNVVKSRMNPDRWKYCLVLPGKIKSVNGKEGEVETPLGIREVNLSFLKEKDLLNKHVTIHYYHACEIISEEEFNKLWEIKNEQRN